MLAVTFGKCLLNFQIEIYITRLLLDPSRNFDVALDIVRRRFDLDDLADRLDHRGLP